MIQTLGSLIIQAQGAHYNHENKLEWKKDGTRFMRAVAKHLGLVKGSYEVRFNPGGIAVSGDCILHSEGLYLHLNDFGFYWRTVSGRKDYTGGYNRQMSVGFNANQVATSISMQLGKDGIK